MPLYFFHFTNGAHAIPDIEGLNFADIAAARDCAVDDARYLIEKNQVPGWKRWRVEVTDEAGRALITIPFTDVWDSGDGGTAHAA